MRNAQGLSLSEEGQVLTLRQADGRALRRWPLRDLRGHSGGVLAMRDASARRSFIVALQGLPELREIAYDPAAPPLFEGLVHDYRMAEAIGEPGYLARRRIQLEAPLSALFFDPRMPWLLARQGEQTVVLHLDVRRQVANLGAARVDTAVLLRHEGRWLLNLDEAGAQIWLDTQHWQAVAPPVLQPGSRP